MEFSFSALDDKQLRKALDRLPRTIRNRALRKGLHAGGQAIKKRAAANVLAITSDEATGLLARRLVVRSRKQTRTAIGVRVTIGRGVAKNGARIGLYGSVLEFGKENQPPRPWLRPAAEQTGPQTVTVIAKESARWLDDAVKAARGGQE